MIGLLVLVALIVSFYVGGRRGAPYQLVFSFGYLITFLIALGTYKGLAKKLELYVPYPSVTPDSSMVFYDQTESLDLDQAYYAAMAFLLVIVIGAIVVRFLAIFLNDLRYKRLKVLGQNDWMLASGLSMLNVLLVIFFVLFVLSLIPLATVQNIFRKSLTARLIVQYTPIISWLFKRLWVTNILS